MEEGEEGAEIQDQGLAQATAASESRDDTTGNSWGHAKFARGCLRQQSIFEKWQK